MNKAMSIFKKLLSFILCALLVLSCAFAAPVKIDAGAAVSSAKIAELKKKFPDGKYWNHVGSTKNNPDGYTSKPCTHHGAGGSGCSITEGGCECNYFNKAIQCAGYAYKIAYELTGSLASEGNGWTKTTTLNASKLAVGDIIRYLGNRHSICVVGVKGDTIAYTGANWGGNCLIRWGTMDISQLTGFSYVYHKTDNKYTNPDLSVVDDSTSEIWKTNSDNDANLNIRSSSTTSAKVIGKIPAGTKFEVLSKTYSTTTKYLWAKIKYNGLTGYCVLNYATYVSGSVETIKLINLSDIYAGVDCTLNWNAIDGADIYKLFLYDSSGQLSKTYTCESTSRTIKIAKAGEYYIRLAAKNSQVKSWSVESGKIAVTVFASNLLKLTDISLPESLSVCAGMTEYCDYEITPYGAVNDMKWESSDPTVATVSASGVISAKKCGKTTITCSSKSDSHISSKCSVLVIPATVTGLKQIASGSGTDKVKVQWNAVNGASGYSIYILNSDGKTYRKIKDTTSTSYTRTSLKPGTSRSISVRAFITLAGKTYYGNYSPLLKARTTPGQVKGLKCTSQTPTGFKLAWTKTKGANGYYIYKYTSDGKKLKRIAISKTNSLSLSGDSKGRAGKYVVRAVCSHDGVRLLGAVSDVVLGFRAPTAPNLSTTAQKTSVILKWTPSVGATKYEVFIHGSSGYRLVATLKSTSTAYTVTGLKSGVTYKFKVKAITAHGTQTKTTASKPISVKTK